MNFVIHIKISQIDHFCINAQSLRRKGWGNVLDVLF